MSARTRSKKSGIWAPRSPPHSQLRIAALLATAALKRLGPAAQQVAEAMEAAVAEVRAVAERGGHSEDDFRGALAAVVTFSRRQVAVDDVVAELLSVLETGGVSRGAMSRTSGVRPVTVQKWLAPYTGRGGDG